MKQERAKWDDGIHTGTCTQYSGRFSDLIEMIRKAEFGSEDKSKTWIKDLGAFLKTCKARAEEMERGQERYWGDFRMDCVHLESYLESLKSGEYQGTQDAAFCAFQMGILYERLLARMASTHLEKRHKGLEAAAKGGKAKGYSPKKKETKKRKYLKLYLDHYEANPSQGRSEILKKISERYKVSVSHLREYLTKEILDKAECKDF